MSPRRGVCFVVAVAMLAALAACSSSSSGVTAVCRPDAAVQLPRATGGQAGDVRWSASVARCAGSSGQVWTGTGGSPMAWAAVVPGGRLAVVVDGVVSLYDTTNGNRLWQRDLAPGAGGRAVARVEATSSRLMVQLNAVQGQLTSFLDLADGALQGRANAVLDGSPFLVGAHVVLSSGSQLSGYDPVTARTLWSARVPDAPDDAAEVNDGTDVFLNPAAHAGASTRIDRLDAASGRMATPLTLPKPVSFDLSTEGGNEVEQGLLLLLTRESTTVAVDPASGKVRWTDPDEVVGGPGLFTTGGTGTLTTVDPRTGRTGWTLQLPGLDTEGGPDVLLALQAGAVTWSAAPGDRWTVTGISPDGTRTWSSPALTQATFLAEDAANIYVVGCVPATGDPSDRCSDVTLTAVAT